MDAAHGATSALYSMTPTQTTAAPQCSQSCDFCFLCEFSEEGSEVVNQIKSIGHQLSAEKKEVGVVAAAMVEAYDELARSDVTWKSDTGEQVAAPAWSRTSAARHLMFSVEFQAFDNAVDQIFHTLIYKLNATAVDRTTGIVVEDTRKALVDTIHKYSTWKSAQQARSQDAAGGVSNSRKRKVSSN